MQTVKNRNLVKIAVLVLATSLALTAYPGGTGPPPALAGRAGCWMTGGGSVFQSDGSEVQWGGPQDGRVTHGFELRCDMRNPNNLEINWEGNRFHLENLEGAECPDDPAIDPNPPDASFDTYIGWGTGRYNGVPGAWARWTFTDAGEPGVPDTASIMIIADGNVVLNVSGPLTFGNHQAHSE